MPRFFGHKQGVDALVRTVQACADRGIEYLTVFAFSSENWKRPSEEVSGLMGLVLVAVSKYLTKLAERRRAHPHRRRPQRRSPTSCAHAWDQAERSTRAQHAHHAVGGLQLRRPLGHRPGLPAGHGRRASSPTTSTRRRCPRYMALSLRARSRPLHPHRRRSAHQQLPALAGGVFRARLHRLPVARLRRGGARRGAGRSTRAATAASARVDAAELVAAARLGLIRMLKQRVITAVVLLAVLLPALLVDDGLAVRCPDAGC